MTETSILPGADPAVDSSVGSVPPQDSDHHDESDGKGNRRNLIILAAIAGVVILAAAAYFLLFSGSSSSNSPTSGAVPHGTFRGTSAPGTPASGTNASGASAKTASASSNGGNSAKTAGKSSHGASLLPPVVKHPKVRDPFKPLITAPVSTSGSPASTTNVTAPTTPTSTSPTTTTSTSTTPPVVTPPSTGKTTTTGSGKTVGSPLWIQLVKTKGDVASFKVGYAHHKFRRYNVQAPKATSSSGTLFDKIFALVGIQNGEVTLQIGDATPFDLTTGIAHVV